MIDFSAWLDLPLIWGLLLATAIFLYVILDGFDLGCGILFPFAPSDACRSRMINSIAPFWDGNETWLVLGGGGLLVAFPVAYAIILPALYLPITLMLIGLVFRGVAFEFRFKASKKNRSLWDSAFHGGSLLAALMQGMILGNFVQGMAVEGRSFSGGPLDWANAFAFLNAIALVFGYSLIGATWVIMKTDGITQSWARSAARYALCFVALGMSLVTTALPFLKSAPVSFWLQPYSPYILIGALLTLLGLIQILWRDLKNPACEVRPFLLSMALFFLAYLLFALSIYPWIVPFHFTLWQAAAAPTSLSIVLIGTVPLLPVILGYTAYCYYVFRGKSSEEPMY